MLYLLSIKSVYLMVSSYPSTMFRLALKEMFWLGSETGSRLALQEWDMIQTLLGNKEVQGE